MIPRELAPGAQPVMQEWTFHLTRMQQAVLLSAVRGPDGIEKYHPAKNIVRWYRRCILLVSFGGLVIENPWDERGGSFTGPSIKVHALYREDQAFIRARLDDMVTDYIRTLDMVPHHFQMHVMHAAEILGYKHPKPFIRSFWLATYHRLVNDMHLLPEPEAELDRRLSDDEDEWRRKNDPATAE